MTRLSIGRAWDETKAVLGSELRLLLPVVLTFGVLPGTLLGTVMPTPPTGGQGSPLLLAGLILVAFLTYWGVVAVQRIAIRSGEQVGEAVRRSALPTLKVLTATILISIPLAILLTPFIPALLAGDEAAKASAALAILGVLILLLLPLSRALLAFPVAAVEGRGVLAMLARSWRLTRGNSFKLFGLSLVFLLLLGLATWAATAAVGTVVLLIAGQPEPLSVSALALSLGSQLAQAAIALPFSVLLARLYRQAVQHDEPVGVPDAP